MYEYVRVCVIYFWSALDTQLEMTKIKAHLIK